MPERWAKKVPEKNPVTTQKTANGYEIPIATRKVLGDLKRIAKASKPKTPTEGPLDYPHRLP